MTTEHTYRARRVRELAAALHEGDVVYVGHGIADPDAPVPRLDVLASMLRARGLELRPTAPYYYAVAARHRRPGPAAAPVSAGCAACSYPRIAWGRCQRCGTCAPSPAREAEAT